MYNQKNEENIVRQGPITKSDQSPIREHSDTMCSMPSIEEQAQNAYFRAQLSMKESERLTELDSLLKKNPETKRILQLLNICN